MKTSSFLFAGLFALVDCRIPRIQIHIDGSIFIAHIFPCLTQARFEGCRNADAFTFEFCHHISSVLGKLLEHDSCMRFTQQIAFFYFPPGTKFNIAKSIHNSHSPYSLKFGQFAYFLYNAIIFYHILC